MRPSSQRWWYAGTAAFVPAVAALFIYGVGSPSGPGARSAAERPVVTQPSTAAVSPSRTQSASPSPTASASRGAYPSASATASLPAANRTKPAAGTIASAPRPVTAPAGKRAITVVNRTGKTVWAVLSNTHIYPQGSKLAPGQSMSVTVANNWGGRIWGRTGCTSTAAGYCGTGDCTSVCQGANPLITLGEFTFDAYAGLDFYDVIMVDGSNLPMYINVSHTTTTDPVTSSGCYKGVCTLEVDCTSAMRAVSGGQVVGCKPPCAAFGGDTYCCRGAWAGREHCVPSKWLVDYIKVFKRAAPYAYSYAFDDAATMSCNGACYYRVTFGTTG